MCSETRAFSRLWVLTVATPPPTLLLVILLNYISELCPSVPFLLSLLQVKLLKTSLFTCFQICTFNSIRNDSNSLPFLSGRKVCLSDVHLVQLFPQHILLWKEQKGFPQFTIKNNTSSLLDACLLKNANIRNDGTPCFRIVFKSLWSGFKVHI